MSRVDNFRAGLVALLTLTAFANVPFAKADGGGAGPRFLTPTIQYDSEADDDEIDEPPKGYVWLTKKGVRWDPWAATAIPRAQAVNSRFGFASDEPAQPLQLKGLDTKYSTDFSLGVRFTYRYPSADDGESRDTPDPAAPSTKYSHDVSLSYAGVWVNERALEDLAAEEQRRGDAATKSPEPGRAFPDITPEAEERLDRALRQWANRQSARSWLGDDAYKKLRAQFGPADDNAAARDGSEWRQNYYYCGGACVAAGY